MSLLSKSCVYGLRAAVFVATNQEPDRFVSIRDIAQRLDISFHFLTKILQQLTESGIMISYRGPHGGVALARAADTLSVKDVIDSLEGPDTFTSCILGLEGCGERSPCPLHGRWSAERTRMRDILARTKLSEVARQVRDRKMRLTDDGDVLTLAPPRRRGKRGV